MGRSRGVVLSFLYSLSRRLLELLVLRMPSKRAKEMIAAIDALDTGVRGGPDPELINRELYPFKVEN